MTSKRRGTWTLWSKNQSKPHNNVIYKYFMTIREVSKKLARVPKSVCYRSLKSPETDVFKKNKIRTRLARRPTLVVLCLKLWSVRGGGTVLVTKCVILASVWATNCLLGKATKRPVKGLERGPYGWKIYRNLIKCHLQGFCDNPGGFQKIGPGAENRVL
jgi:hypothetical protein